MEIKTFYQDKKRDVTLTLFFIFIAMLLSSIVFGLIFKFTVGNIKNVFDDFAAVLSYCIMDNTYFAEGEMATIYPPIAFLIYYPFALICKDDINLYISNQICLNDLATSKMFLISYSLFAFLQLSLLIFILYNLIQSNKIHNVIITLMLVLSGPIIYTFIRGNVIITAFMFALLFYEFYNSEKRWKKELSLVFLALSISMKIYPVILSLYLLNKSDFKSILKTAIYTVIFVFLPFIFINGNFIDNIIKFFKNCFSFNSNHLSKYGLTNISFSNVLNLIFLEIGNLLNVNLLNISKYISLFIKICLIITALILVIKYRNTTREMEILIIIITTYILIQEISYAYSVCFMLILFLLFFKQIKNLKKKDFIIYSILYFALFCQFFYIIRFCILQHFILIALLIKAIYDLVNKNKIEDVQNENFI